MTGLINVCQFLLLPILSLQEAGTGSHISLWGLNNGLQQHIGQ